MTETKAYGEARRRTAQAVVPDRLLESLGRRIGERAGTEAVFGEAIVNSGLTVVPVARVRWGFGGGSGAAGAQGETAPGGDSGEGGGGGVAADPIGYIEIRPEGASFRAIPQLPSAFFILACGITASVVLRAFARLAESRQATGTSQP